jgi:carotenoid cleavage dioxygenase
MAMTDAVSPAADAAKPWHLRGNFAPVTDEIEAVDLAVTGSLPAALDGLFVRNGANPKNGASPHWFLGDGMLHGVRIEAGRVRWYRNRYVRTRAFGGADRMDPANITDHSISLANTHVLAHAGRLLCLEVGSFPTQVDLDLDTVGTLDFGGKLTTAFTAHPKLCPETGEMLAFGYGFMDPYLTYLRVSATGDLVQTTPITVPGPTMMHDFAATRNHVIFFDLPVVFDLERAMAGDMPYGWSDTYGARMGVMPRQGTDADVKWFDVDPCYVFHTMNAFEDAQGRVVVDAGRHASMWKDSASDFEPCHLWRWTFDPATGAVGEQQLDDASHAFPRLDDRLAGLPYRYGYAVLSRDDRTASMDADQVLVRYDLNSGDRQLHDPGLGRMCGEPVFVPAGPDAAEDDGYVMAYVYDKAEDRTSLVVLGAQDFSAGPVATVPLPRRIPHGFHGSWVPADAVGGGA